MQVLIVSTNAETLEGLQDYLRSVGVPCRTTEDIGALAATDPRAPTSAVIFPDDLAHVDVPALLRTLRSSHPLLRPLLVTRDPSRFHDLARSPDNVGAMLVLPRPSFGWEILDALLAHADGLTQT